jgi:hypothetical protein
VTPFDPTSAPPLPDAAARTFAFTFGEAPTQRIWTDRRTTTWSELAAFLTKHEVGPKVGPCFVPAVFRGTRRHKADVDQIGMAVLDSDCGHTLEEIETAFRSHGGRAVVHSTHSHMTTTTTVNRPPGTSFCRMPD